MYNTRRNDLLNFYVAEDFLPGYSDTSLLANQAATEAELSLPEFDETNSNFVISQNDDIPGDTSSTTVLPLDGSVFSSAIDFGGDCLTSTPVSQI